MSNTTHHGDHHHQGDSHGHGEFTSRDLRILAVFVVAICALLGTVTAPLLLKIFGGTDKTKADLLIKKVLRVLTAVGIGVTLGTGLLHLIPEAAEMLAESIGGESHAHHAGHGPAAHHDDHDHDHGHDDHHANETTAVAPTAVAGTTMAPAPNATTAPGDDHHHDDHDHDEEGDHHDEHGHGTHTDDEEGHDHPFPYAHAIALGSAVLMYAFEHELHAVVIRRRQEAKKASSRQPAEEGGVMTQAATCDPNDTKNIDSASASTDDVAAKPQDSGLVTAVVVVAEPDCKTAEEREEEALHEAQMKAMSSHIVNVGFSVHAMLLGITLGLLTGYGNVRVLFIVIAFDQFADGVAVGATLSAATLLTMLHTSLLRVVFSLACAIGISIGLIIDAAGSAADKTAQGVLASISGGMLLVIAFSNMLPVLTKPFNYEADCCLHGTGDENNADEDEGEACAHEQGAAGEEPLSVAWRVVLYFCVAFGVAVMAVIAIWGH